MITASSLALGVRLGYYIPRTTYCHLSPALTKFDHSVNSDDITELTFGHNFGTQWR
jgi:hypothetical protein